MQHTQKGRSIKKTLALELTTDIGGFMEESSSEDLLSSESSDLSSQSSWSSESDLSSHSSQSNPSSFSSQSSLSSLSSDELSSEGDISSGGSDSSGDGIYFVLMKASVLNPNAVDFSSNPSTTLSYLMPHKKYEISDIQLQNPASPYVITSINIDNGTVTIAPKSSAPTSGLDYQDEVFVFKLSSGPADMIASIKLSIDTTLFAALEAFLDTYNIASDVIATFGTTSKSALSASGPFTDSQSTQFSLVAKETMNDKLNITIGGNLSETFADKGNSLNISKSYGLTISGTFTIATNSIGNTTINGSIGELWTVSKSTDSGTFSAGAYLSISGGDTNYVAFTLQTGIFFFITRSSNGSQSPTLMLGLGGTLTF